MWLGFSLNCHLKVEKPVGPVNLSAVHQIYDIVKTAQFCPKAEEISPKPRKIRFFWQYVVGAWIEFTRNFKSV